MSWVFFSEKASPSCSLLNSEPPPLPIWLFIRKLKSYFCTTQGRYPSLCLDHSFQDSLGFSLIFTPENPTGCLLFQSLSHVRLFCDSMDCSPPGSSVHGIFQARILEWVAIPFSRGSSLPRYQTHISCTAGRMFNKQKTNFPLSPLNIFMLFRIWNWLPLISIFKTGSIVSFTTYNFINIHPKFYIPNSFFWPISKDILSSLLLLLGRFSCVRLCVTP